MQALFADIIIPVAIKGRFTYSIPERLAARAKTGTRATVQLGNKKLYTGIICRVHNETPEYKNIRPLIDITDNESLVNEKQLRFWRWLSDYYMCTEGEVMNAALPSVFLPEGVTSSPMPERYKPREETYIILSKQYSDDELNSLLDRMKKAPGQAALINSFLYMTGYTAGSELTPVRKSLLLKESGSTTAIISSLEKKGIIRSLQMEVGRLKQYDDLQHPPRELSDIQKSAFASIKEHFAERDIVLLHGITSSGKTEIYIHLISEQLKQGKQVLYMLPEIALTSQIIVRLQKHFGDVTGVYHSRFSDQEKAEIWKKVADKDPEKGFRLVLGVRSSIFLPFSSLGLVIVDEEHDGSYKQHDPAPRYHARDSAIVLAGYHGAKTLLGSASPSVESYHNAIGGKYGLVELKERYGSIRLPEIIVGNTREAYRKKLMVSHFTPELLYAMDTALSKNEQVILFQNRRGFSPYLECPECGWIPVCTQCAVNLTYHKGINRLVCHYCGYNTHVDSRCGSCGSPGLATRGFGTEKIEDEIKIVFPGARVERLDQDSTRGRNSFGRIIKAFEEGRTDILIGTQMISKGLDFENLTVVGILNADNMLNFPDFRAHERSFQLMEQVSGRAGRRKKQGKVIIQTADPSHRVIRLVLRHDYEGMYKIQAGERMTFSYPPFCRMVRINLKHHDRALLNNFADVFGNDLRSMFGKSILGPEFPVISRIQLWYIKTILVKIDKERSLGKAKEMISSAIERLEKEKGASGLRIAVDVDPY